MNYLYDYINKKLPSSFDVFFTFQSEVNSMVTRQSARGSVFMPVIESERYGRQSIKHQAILAWNQILRIFPNEDFHTILRIKFKRVIKDHFIPLYQSDPN